MIPEYQWIHSILSNTHCQSMQIVWIYNTLLDNYDKKYEIQSNIFAEKQGKKSNIQTFRKYIFIMVKTKDVNVGTRIIQCIEIIQFF